MDTEDVLNKIQNKTIKKAEPYYAGNDLYLIKLYFTDGTSIEIDNEHKEDKILQVKFV